MSTVLTSCLDATSGPYCDKYLPRAKAMTARLRSEIGIRVGGRCRYSVCSPNWKVGTPKFEETRIADATHVDDAMRRTWGVCGLKSVAFPLVCNHTSLCSK